MLNVLINIECSNYRNEKVILNVLIVGMTTALRVEKV